jgi:hypothetical protein
MQVTTNVQEAMRQQRVISMGICGTHAEPFSDGDTVLVDTEYTNPTGKDSYLLRIGIGGGSSGNSGYAPGIGKARRCGRWGQNQIWIEDGIGGMDVVTIDEFEELVIGRVVGHVSAKMLNETPVRL